MHPRVTAKPAKAAGGEPARREKDKASAAPAPAAKPARVAP
jgi:hypothetical protein